MTERDELINLYEIYKDLLTEKQRNYFENYYFEDLSLTEIGEIYNVSKSIVGKTLNIVTNKLKEYERALKINKIYKDIEKIIDKTKDESIKKELEEIIK